MSLDLKLVHQQRFTLSENYQDNNTIASPYILIKSMHPNNHTTNSKIELSFRQESLDDPSPETTAQSHLSTLTRIEHVLSSTAPPSQQLQRIETLLQHQKLLQIGESLHSNTKIEDLSCQNRVRRESEDLHILTPDKSDKLHRENVVLKKWIEELQEEVRSLTQQFQEGHNSIEEKDEELKFVFRQYQELKESAERNEQEMREMRITEADLRGRLEQMAADIKVKREDLKALKASRDTMASELNNLREQFQQLERKNRDLDQQNMDMRVESDKVAKEIKVKWNQIEKVHQIVIDLKKEAQFYKAETIKLQKLVRQSNDRFTIKEATFVKKVEELESNLKRGEFINRGLIQKLENKEREVTSLGLQKTKLENEHERLREEMGKIIFNLNKTREEGNHLRSQVGNLQTLLSILREQRQKLESVFKALGFSLESLLQGGAIVYDQLRRRVLLFLGARERKEAEDFCDFVNY